MTNIELPAPTGKTEAKVKAATYAAFAATLVVSTALEWLSTDLIPALPNSLNWLVPILSAAISSALTWVGGYYKRTKPESLSQSTVDAIKQWLRNRAPHIGGTR